MPYPDGVAVATLTFSNPGTFLGQATEQTTMEVSATASVVWAATGVPIDNFTESVTPTPGMPGSLTVPFVDQAGFVDTAGNSFMMWAYRLTRRTWLGGRAITVVKTWQPLMGQSTVDFDMLPGGTIGLPVAVQIPPVTSVAGETGAVGAEALAGALVPFLPDGASVTPESVAANLPARLEESAIESKIVATLSSTPADAAIAGVIKGAGTATATALNATILDQMETAMEPAAAVAVNDALAVAVTTSTSYVHGGSALVIGPAIPFGLTPGKEFIWYKTDGAGGLLDIVAGVMPEAFTDWESLTLLYPTWEAVTAAFPTWEALNSSIATV